MDISLVAVFIYVARQEYVRKVIPHSQKYILYTYVSHKNQSLSTRFPGYYPVLHMTIPTKIAVNRRF